MFRLGALGLAVALFCSLEWMPVRRLVRAAVAAGLAWLGHATSTLDAPQGPCLIVSGHRVGLSASCTYLDLILVLVPLCWSARAKLGSNLLRVAVMAVTIFALNLLRVVFALHWSVLGHSWYWAHTFPDVIIRSFAIGLAALLVLRADWRDTSLSHLGGPQKSSAGGHSQNDRC